jgi:hypothetical protein
MNLILNKSQAEAVYSAMCALNNVGGLVRIALENDIDVYERDDDTIAVLSDGPAERHTNQAAFATAYGLQQG